MLRRWTVPARFCQALIEKTSTAPYIVAARAVGAGGLRVVARHIWPSMLGQLYVQTSPFMGYIIMAEAECDNVTEMTSGFGKLGVPAEAVGEHAAKRMAGYMASTAAVGPYLADQLLLPFAVAGRWSFPRLFQKNPGSFGSGALPRVRPIRVHSRNSW